MPEDVAQVGSMYLGVPRNSTHPILAKLFINAVMSEPGQRILYETYYADHPQLPGSQSAAAAPCPATSTASSCACFVRRKLPHGG